MKRSYGCKQILLGLILVVAVTGCASGKPTKDSASSSGGDRQIESPSARQMKVKAYYADSNLDKLYERESGITFTTDTEKYKAALQLLKTAPDASLDPLSKGITIRSVNSKDGNVVVDLSISDEGRLGAPGELLLLEAFKKTMFQFNEVQTFDLLVDGKKTESLMGHMSLSHPFKRS